MKYGYNERIQKKITDLDGDWDEWYYLMCVLAAKYKKTPTLGVYTHALLILKRYARHNRFIKRTRLHTLKKTLLEWNTNLSISQLG